MPDPRVIDPTRPHGEDAHYLDGAPAPYDWTQELRALVAAVHNLEVALRQPKRPLPVAGVTAETLDSSGNAVIPIYQVGAGFYFNLTRCCIEAEGYTPGAPYVSATSWLTLAFSTDQTGNPAQGQVFDFAPATAGAQFLPNAADYQDPDTGPLGRSGEWLVCRVSGGPASKRITIRYQGLLRGVEA